MLKKIIPLLLLPFALKAQPFTTAEQSRWKQEAARVTIIRDRWGIPHVYGKTDADAVFGLIYAQCEDDFPRVEANYLEKLGRLAEVQGASAIWGDLYNRMIIDTAAAETDYRNAPPWLKKLMDAWADGINYYLFTHPTVKPALLRRFKSWYPLLWTDGSIGAINTAELGERDLQRMYDKKDQPVAMRTADLYRDPEEHPSGSNGFAIAPSKTASHHAILYINPHVTFYFRPEVQMVSEEGLNAYGAVTWGQFFIYQGFNPWCGWMHTSNKTDVADLYIEKITTTNGKRYYQYEGKQLPLMEKTIPVRYIENGELKERRFIAAYTGHGPIMGKRDGQFLSVKAVNRDIKGLLQSWLRTKAKGYADFKNVMELRSNGSNNTVFADAQGNIAYWHGNFMPRRDPKLDWSKPVDGTVSATEWKGMHDTKEMIHIHNPVNGWIQNCNSTPFTAAGAFSPRREDYPAYMAPDGENFRGINAVRQLSGDSNYTIEKVIEKGYTTYLPGFEALVPAIIKAYDGLATEDPLKTSLAGPINELRGWDLHSSETSVAATLAIEWGQQLLPIVMKPGSDDEEDDQVTRVRHYAERAPAKDLLNPLQAVVNDLTSKFGRWQLAWGELNRYQRLTGKLVETYDDNAASLPVGFASSTWGALPSYVSRYVPGQKKRYGYNGNSFICSVEFGPRIKARSLLAGGESGDPKSLHFGDQAEMYARGKFKDVLFYKEDVLLHAEKTYHPGE
jgi:acyl-homoserine-lactone acylase